MATVTIATQDYDSYQGLAEANIYLGADIARAAAWAQMTDDRKGQALVSASRWIASLGLSGGVPDYNTPPAGVADATTVLAAEIAANPKLAQNRTGNTTANIKRVKAGSVETEFFRDAVTPSLPAEVLDILTSAGLTISDDGFAEPYYSGGDEVSRFTYDYPEDWINGW